MNRIKFWTVAVPAAVAALIGLSGCGDDPVEPKVLPVIGEFSAAPADIMPGDSSLLSYTVSNADRTTLTPDGSELSPAGSGSVWVKPPVPTTYVLRSFNDDGSDADTLTISMTGAVPSIDRLDLIPDTIVVGDSLTLAWKTTRADSLIISPAIGKVASPDTADLRLAPSNDVTYTAIAYNAIGRDTAVVNARVEIPFAVQAPAGTFYKGEMGSDLLDPELLFRIVDADQSTLRKPWLHFELVSGDGSLAVDSARPGGSGVIDNPYTFNGQLGYADLRASVPDFASLDVHLRAKVIRFGAGGQGQYVLFSDIYGYVKALNGAPLSVDPDPRPEYILNYANYENSLGVVFAIIDTNDDDIAQDDEPVIEVILTTLFTEVQSPEGIGIGSSIHDVRNAYGEPDNFFFDNQNEPVAWGMEYYDLGALFYASTVAPDSAIIEIHMGEPVPPAAAGTPSEVEASGRFRRLTQRY